ncbi:heparanase [Arctopsyche grandis]|uniref:heparanase n=1 Tax=Arctopsyche grandis TaxID=121162 RepID=UPI00406D9F9D
MTFRSRFMGRDTLILTYTSIFAIALIVHLITRSLIYLVPPNILYIDVQTAPIHVTSDRYLSFGVDTIQIATSVDNVPFDSRRFQNLTSLLGPAYIRLGGTLSDRLIFMEDSIQTSIPEEIYYRIQECAQNNTSCAGKFLPYFVMSSGDLIKINDFCKKTNSRLLFDLNALFRNGTDWDSTNTEQLLSFASTHEITKNIDWQLGNEPNSFRHVFNVTVPPEQMARDFVHLRALIENYSPGSKLVGPDTTRPQPKRPDCVQYMKDFLTTLEKYDENTNLSDYLDAVAWHQYYLNGREATLEDFWNPDTFELLKSQIDTMRENIDNIRGDIPMWLSETSSAYGGGAPGLSNSFSGSPLWLDKLGLAAKNAISVVVRQSLFGGSYSMIGKDLSPSPDWWVSLLYKRLVGNEVIDCRLDSDKNKLQRIYCHCSAKFIRTKGNMVTVFAINLSKVATYFQLEGTAIGKNITTEEYILTSSTDRKSTNISLNGVVLKYDDDLPRILPKKLQTANKLRMPGYSLGFWVIHNVKVPFCRSL